MTTQQATRRPGLPMAGLAAIIVGLLAAGGLLLAAPAQASIRTVTLTAQGPSPVKLTVGKGDVVNFINVDNVSHTVTRTSGAWTFNAVIDAGKSKTSQPFGATGTFGYSDTHAVVLTDNGSIVVQAGAPAPTASPKPSPKPTPTTSPAPKPTASTTPSPSATPTPQPTRSGTAIGPGIGVGTFPSAGPGATVGPRPDVAAPLPSASSEVHNLGYSGRGLVQDSPHRYGLPAALAVVAILGMLSLLVRLLLAEPAAARRHTAHS